MCPALRVEKSYELKLFCNRPAVDIGRSISLFLYLPTYLSESLSLHLYFSGRLAVMRSMTMSGDRWIWAGLLFPTPPMTGPVGHATIETGILGIY